MRLALYSSTPKSSAFDARQAVDLSRSRPPMATCATRRVVRFDWFTAFAGWDAYATAGQFKVHVDALLQPRLHSTHTPPDRPQIKN